MPEASLFIAALTPIAKREARCNHHDDNGMTVDPTFPDLMTLVICYSLRTGK